MPETSFPRWTVLPLVFLLGLGVGYLLLGGCGVLPMPGGSWPCAECPETGQPPVYYLNAILVQVDRAQKAQPSQITLEDAARVHVLVAKCAVNFLPSTLPPEVHCAKLREALEQAKANQWAAVLSGLDHGH